MKRENKMKTSLALTVATLLLILTSCSGNKGKQFYGSWENVEEEYIDDGLLSTVEGFEFEKDIITKYIDIFIDGEPIYGYSISGSWSYDEAGSFLSPGYIGSEAKGVISVKWNLDSFDYYDDYDTDIDFERIKESFVTWNEEYEEITNKNKYKNKTQTVYGYFVLGVDNDELRIEGQDNGIITYDKVTE